MSIMVLRNQLVNRAAISYRTGGHLAYCFARLKLRHDPFYSLLLVDGLIPAGARILDLGCAQGLLAAWLFAARQCHGEGAWDDSCPAPEFVASYRGVDRSRAEIRRARKALGSRAEFVVGDISGEPLTGATLIVLLDVLHYLDFESQLALLRRIRAALPPDGFLLVRVGDCASSLRARVSGWVDSLMLRLRGYGKGKLHRRPLSEWLLLLDEAGFAVQEVARQRSPGYDNSLLRARPRQP